MLTAGRAADAPGHDSSAAREAPGHGFRRAAVIGAGLMGRGIAAVLASGGLDVILCDTEPDTLREAVAAARSRPAPAGGRGEISGSADLARAVRRADLVVEAVVEDLAVKQEVFAAVSAATPDAVLATNTSVLPVTAIAARAQGPGRVLGTHWWNPPDLIPVVEVIPGRLTAATVTERVISLLGHLGKTPVRVRRDVAGFIGNRLQHALWREAITLVADGICDAETADLVARNTVGLRLARMGPIENADYVGLDLTLAIHDAVLPALSAGREPSPLLRALVRRGELGAKTGHGFLPWGPGTWDTAARELAAHVQAQRPSGATRCCAALPAPPLPAPPRPGLPPSGQSPSGTTQHSTPPRGRPE
jgi:3-hydroxybutyryl-CoA dehydrogenase